MTQYEESVKWIADQLGLTVEEIGNDCENIIVNNHAWDDVQFCDDMPEDYPNGWCTKDQWDKFVAAHPDDYWFSWVDMLEENVDFLLENDAIKLKER